MPFATSFFVSLYLLLRFPMELNADILPLRRLKLLLLECNTVTLICSCISATNPVYSHMRGAGCGGNLRICSDSRSSRRVERICSDSISSRCVNRILGTCPHGLLKQHSCAPTTTLYGGVVVTYLGRPHGRNHHHWSRIK